MAEKVSYNTAIESPHRCSRYNVLGLTGVDACAITRLLFDKGTAHDRLAVGDDAALPVPNVNKYWDPSRENLVDKISAKEQYVLNLGGDARMAVPDFGAKANILCDVVRRSTFYRGSTISMLSAIDSMTSFCPIGLETRSGVGPRRTSLVLRDTKGRSPSICF